MADESKLTRTKQHWAQSGKFLTGHTSRPELERLPPGQHLVNNWPVLDLGQTPNIPRERWRLDVGGEVENPFSWNWATFAAQPQEQNLGYSLRYVLVALQQRVEGISARRLIELARPTPEAAFVVFASSDGYTTNMALEDFASADAMLVHSWQGQPLPIEHGGPVRIVVPHLYLWKSAKWIRQIEFTSEDQLGFWEVRGYHNHADPWLEERYS